MIDKLQTIIERYDTLAELMNQPDAMHNMKAFTQLAREHSGLTELVEISKKYIDTYKQLQDDEEILNGDDPELKELVRDEIGHLREDIALQEEMLKVLLIPKDPNDNKNTILEIRSGTGGDEAALFASDLFRMYSRFAERRGWKIDPLVLHENEGGGGGGYKEVIININGKQAYGTLKFESGAIGSLTTYWAFDNGDWSHTNVIDILYKDQLINWNPSRLRIKENDEYIDKAETSLSIDEVFVEAVRSGDRSQILSPYSDAVKTMAISIAANQSGHTSNPIQINTI